MDAQTALRELELYAYSTALKAFMAGPVDEWVREALFSGGPSSLAQLAVQGPRFHALVLACRTRRRL